MRVVTVRLPDDLVEALDRAGGQRSEIIRSALEAHLGGGGVPAAKPEAVPRTAAEVRSELERRGPVDRVTLAGFQSGEGRKKRPLSENARQVLEVLRGGRRTERRLREELGWMELRVSRAVEELSRAGMVRFSEGLVEAV